MIENENIRFIILGLCLLSFAAWSGFECLKSLKTMTIRPVGLALLFSVILQQWVGGCGPDSHRADHKNEFRIWMASNIIAALLLGLLGTWLLTLGL